MEFKDIKQQNIFEDKPLTVTQFISQLNQRIKPFRVKIIGEIGRVDEKNGHRYFSLKDEAGGAVLNCIIWRSRYEMFGINLCEGMKVVVFGAPEIYAPSGKLSLVCESVELAGQGALKKAYDALLKKLSAEGLFEIERKRKLPQFPRVIGVITSKQGAVINDFLTNIGKFGFQIEFVDSRVEGQLAVGDILSAIHTFRSRKIDVLVIIRGGGSPESLQAFNNEMIVRQIVDFPVPVIVGIGHDKDVPLAQMAADISVSTPSIAAMHLNSSWQKLVQYIDQQEISIMAGYKNALNQISAKLYQHRGILANFKYILQNIFRKLDATMADLISKTKNSIAAAQKQIVYLEKIIELRNPERQLKLGYSIAKINGKILKSANSAEIGADLDIILADGKINSQITKIYDREKENWKIKFKR